MSIDKTKKLQIVVIIVALLVVCIFAYLKQGFFMDELYSYGLSNSEGRTDISDYDIYGIEITDNPWDDYLEVQHGEGFHYREVIESQIRDVHPPLYYMMLHTMCSLMPDEFSKWSGLVPNIILYLLTIIVMCAVGRCVIGDGLASVMPAAMWALSAMGIGTAVYIRMYMLLTLLTTCDIYLHILIIKKGLNRKKLLLIALCTILGYLTQYYFLIAAFWMSLMCLIILVKQRKYWDGAIYSGVRLISIIIGVCVFPQVFDQISGRNNQYATSLATTPSFISKMLTNSIAFISDINYGMCSGVVLLAVGLIIFVWIFAFRKDKSEHDTDKQPRLKMTTEDKHMFMLLAAMILDIITIMLVSWIPARRYYFNIIPTLCLLFCYALYRLSERIITPNIASGCLIVSMGVLMGCDIMSYGLTVGGDEGFIQYLYIDNQNMYQEISRSSIEKCIYVTDHRNAAITQDLDILRQMNSVYIVTPDKLEDVLESANKTEDILLIVDKDYEKDIELPDVTDELYSRELSVGYITTNNVIR